MKKHGISVVIPAIGSIHVEQVRVVPLVGYLASAMVNLFGDGFTFHPSDIVDVEGRG